MICDLGFWIADIGLIKGMLPILFFDHQLTLMLPNAQLVTRNSL